MANNAVDPRYSIFLQQTVAVTIDRPLHSKHPKHGFVYELNYGYVPDTLAPDGEEIDAYVIGIDQPIGSFTGRCVAIIHRLDDQDDKLVVVPKGGSLTDEQIIAATHFQERFFQSVVWRG